MNGFVLRVIAMVTMLIDHIGWNFLDNSMILTWIGRIAFPLYAFLLAEGFLIIYHDKERFSKHLAIMLILTAVSFPGYALLEERLDFAHYLDSQSNMITLLIGYFGMMATETLAPSALSATAGRTASAGRAASAAAAASAAHAGKDRPSGMKIAALVVTYVLLGLANYMMKGNFNIVGPLLVIAYYWVIRVSKQSARDGKPWSWGRRLAVNILIFAIYLPVYFWVRSGFGGPALWWKEVLDYAPWIVGHVIAAVIISLYNGELGYHEKWFRRLYTSFYPAHTFVIGLICVLTGR